MSTRGQKRTPLTDSTTYIATCDWGGCDGPSTGLRFDYAFGPGVGEWLAVCEHHAFDGDGGPYLSWSELDVQVPA